MRLRYSKCLWRAGAAALSAVAYCVLLTAQADAKATFVTFDQGQIEGPPNSTNAVTGWRADGNSFVRSGDGTVTVFAVAEATQTEVSCCRFRGHRV